MSLLALALLAGCRPGPVAADDTFAVGATGVPVAITDATATCDADDGVWSFTVATTGWTAGGWVWLASEEESGPYLEKHRMPSVGAARDGSTDALALDLPLAEDFREGGDTTVFPCSADPTGQLLVLDTAGEIADCRGFGPRPEIWAELKQGGCDTPL